MKKIPLSLTHQILIAALVVQVVLAVVFLWPRGTQAAAGEPLIAGLEADQIVHVSITNDQGDEVAFSKELDTWVLTDTGGYPCTQDKVTDLVDGLVALESSRLVTQTPASHKRLKVSKQDFRYQVAFELADGKAYVVYVGTSPSYGASHVRVDGQNQVYLSSNLSTSNVGTSPSMWIDTSYWSTTTDQVVALTLQNANGVFEFSKDEADAWTMEGVAEGEEANETAISSAVTRAASVRMVRPLRIEEQASYDLQQPDAVVTVQTRDEEGVEETVILQVFVHVEGTGEDATTTYVVKASTSPYYVLVSDFTAKDWVEEARDDFLVPPPTPTPEPTTETEPTAESE